MFRKLDFDTIYNAYLNKSPFKYYISILRGVRVLNSGKPAYIILARSVILYLSFLFPNPLSLIPDPSFPFSFPSSLIPYPQSLVRYPSSLIPKYSSPIPYTLSLMPYLLSLIPYPIYLVPSDLILVSYYCLLLIQ